MSKTTLIYLLPDIKELAVKKSHKIYGKVNLSKYLTELILKDNEKK